MCRGSPKLNSNTHIPGGPSLKFHPQLHGNATVSAALSPLPNTCEVPLFLFRRKAHRTCCGNKTPNFPPIAPAILTVGEHPHSSLGPDLGQGEEKGHIIHCPDFMRPSLHTGGLSSVLDFQPPLHTHPTCCSGYFMSPPFSLTLSPSPTSSIRPLPKPSSWSPLDLLLPAPISLRGARPWYRPTLLCHTHLWFGSKSYQLYLQNISQISYFSPLLSLVFFSLLTSGS